MLIINTRKICLNFNASESFTNMTIDGAIDKRPTFYLLLCLLFYINNVTTTKHCCFENNYYYLKAISVKYIKVWINIF